MAKTWLKHEVRIVIHPLFWGNRVAFILHLDDWTWWSQTWLKMYILRPKFQKGNLCFFPSSSAVLSLVLNMFSLKKNQSLIDKPSKGNYPKKWVKWTLDEFPQHFPPRVHHCATAPTQGLSKKPFGRWTWSVRSSGKCCEAMVRDRLPSGSRWFNMV